MRARPSVSVVVESVTARADWGQSDLATALRPVLGALSRQTVQDFETVVVVGSRGSFGEDVDGELPPRTRVVRESSDNYFAAKNEGARNAVGELILFLDSDTVPAPHWFEGMVTAFGPNVDVVAGRTVYAGRRLTSRTLSRMILAVTAGPDGRASGFVANNVGFRRDVFMSRLFDERIPRHGGCYLLYHQLRRDGIHVAYAPEAEVEHGLDMRGLRYLRKQYERGADAVTVHRLDEQGALSGTRLRRDHPWLAPFAFGLRRMSIDMATLSRSRSRAPVRAADVPGAAVLMASGRLAGLAGELAATFRPGRQASSRPG